jgi:hypothetical protein
MQERLRRLGRDGELGLELLLPGFERASASSSSLSVRAGTPSAIASTIRRSRRSTWASSERSRSRRAFSFPRTR